MQNDIILENKIMYQALLHGARSVIKQKHILNELNVFPVQDKDTGNNLSALMQAIIQQAKIGQTIDETLESIADAALMGSRGNSGLIFSQFLYGFTKTYAGDHAYSDFIRRVESGVKYAYGSVNNPVEGTMITLMRKWGELLKTEQFNHDSFEAYLLDVNAKLKIALETTKDELEILKKHDVVDAGALGFTLFVEGFVESLFNKLPNTQIIDVEIKHDLEQIHVHDETINYRYCTEVLLQTSITKQELTNKLKAYGDSLVVGESTRLKRVHIHTNNPETIIEAMRPLGQILETKVDDMKKQYEAINEKQYDTCILTDSIADLPKSFIDSNPIHVFPIGLNLDDVVYFDKLTITNKQLFEYIKHAGQYPSSFTPSIKAIDAQISFLSKHYKHIIIATVSSKMSGIHNLFNKVIETYKQTDILLIDTKQNSVSEGLIIHELSTWITLGKTFKEIKVAYAALLKRTQILVHVDTLDNMVRSGRIKKSLGLVGKLLHLKPVVSIDTSGEGIVLAKSIGQNNNFKKILKIVQQTHKHYGIHKYAIVHVSNLKLAEKLKTEIIKSTGVAPEYVGGLSSIIAMNSGIGSVAVGIIRKV